MWEQGLRDTILAWISEAQAATIDAAFATANRIANERDRSRAIWRIGIARARSGDASFLLASANPNGRSPYWRVLDLIAAIDEVLDDRVFDPTDPYQFLGDNPLRLRP